MITKSEYRDLAADVELLYTNYCEVLDDGNIDRWPNFFANDCLYRVTTKENQERGMPLNFVFCEGLPMVRDRAAGLREAVFHRSRSQRRVISGMRLKTLDGIDIGGIETCATFLIYESLGDGPSQLLSCGRSSDVIVREGNELKFKQRLCVIDARVMPDSLVYPI